MSERDTIDQDELQALLDEAACRKVLSQYGPGLDWRDPDALARTLWPDAYIDYGFFKDLGFIVDAEDERHLPCPRPSIDGRRRTRARTSPHSKATQLRSDSGAS